MQVNLGLPKLSFLKNTISKYFASEHLLPFLPGRPDLHPLPVHLRLPKCGKREHIVTQIVYSQGSFNDNALYNNSNY